MENYSLAERLGYKRNDRLLIIHADDVGISHSANRATIEAFEAGIVTCGSIMVPCPWFPEIAAYCREHPEVDLGIHLTTTSEWEYYRWGPVASRDRVASLLDEEGFLWRTREQMVQHARLEEVEIELRAQIERALEFGVKPTHLDPHMHIAFGNLKTFELYCHLGREYNIPPVLAKSTPEIEAVQQLSLPIIDWGIDGLTLGIGETLAEKKASYYGALSGLKPGVTELRLHLGMDDDEMSAIMGNHHMLRYYDYRVFTDPETKRLIGKLQIKLIGWKHIAVLMKV